MMKKTLIKRAYKSWPMTNTRERLETAIDVSNEADVIELNQTTKSLDSGAIKKARALLSALQRDESQFMDHAVRIFKRDVKSLEDLTNQELNQSISMLTNFVEKKQSQDEKPAIEPSQKELKNYAPGSDSDGSAK